MERKRVSLSVNSHYGSIFDEIANDETTKLLMLKLYRLYRVIIID